MADEGSLRDASTDGRAGAWLLLTFDQQELLVDPGDCVLLGCGAACDLRVERPTVSRTHLKIFRRESYFVAVDQSTNGVFLQTEDRAVTHFKRQEQRLWGCGWFALGETLSMESAIRFQLVEGP